MNTVTVPAPIIDAASIQKLLFYSWVEACIQERLKFKKYFLYNYVFALHHKIKN